MTGNTRQRCTPLGPLCSNWSNNCKTWFLPGWFVSDLDKWRRIERSRLLLETSALRIFNVTYLSSLEAGKRKFDSRGQNTKQDEVNTTLYLQQAKLWKTDQMPIFQQSDTYAGKCPRGELGGSLQYDTLRQVRQHRKCVQSDAFSSTQLIRWWHQARLYRWQKDGMAGKEQSVRNETNGWLRIGEPGSW